MQQSIQAQVLKIDKHISKYTNEDVFVLYFKSTEGKSYKCWVDPHDRNYRYWSQIIQRGKGTILRDLYVKIGTKNLIDADSMPSIVKDDFREHTSDFGNSNIPSGYNFDGERE
jgi:hypothetical protein